MFTGLIAAIGTVTAIRPFGKGVSIEINIAALGEIPSVGASIAVNGVCLTVTAVSNRVVSFDAVEETVSRSNLDALHGGDKVNLEAALRVGDPLDGHIVQGHVDDTGKIAAIRKNPESWVFTISLPSVIAELVVAKGSIAVDGISLTVADVFSDCFTVSIIPHTLGATTLSSARVGDTVNLEADVLARYVAGKHRAKGMSQDFLQKHGF